MTPKPLSRHARLKLLRLDLRYFQMQCRTELRWLKQTRAKIHEIARKMRAVQKEK